MRSSSDEDGAGVPKVVTAYVKLRIVGPLFLSQEELHVTR